MFCYVYWFYTASFQVFQEKFNDGNLEYADLKVQVQIAKIWTRREFFIYQLSNLQVYRACLKLYQAN